MKVNTLTPNLAVSDIRQTVQFYCENLGYIKDNNGYILDFASTEEKPKAYLSTGWNISQKCC